MVVVTLLVAIISYLIIRPIATILLVGILLPAFPVVVIIVLAVLAPKSKEPELEARLDMLFDRMEAQQFVIFLMLVFHPRVDVNARNLDGETPLQVCYRSDNAHFDELLRGRGATWEGGVKAEARRLMYIAARWYRRIRYWLYRA